MKPVEAPWVYLRYLTRITSLPDSNISLVAKADSEKLSSCNAYYSLPLKYMSTINTIKTSTQHSNMK